MSDRAWGDGPERPRCREGLRSKGIGDDRVVFDEQRGEVHFLNRTGRLIWEHCDGTMDCDQIAHALKDSCRTEGDDLEVNVAADVREFCADLHRKGLLVGTPETAPTPAPTDTGNRNDDRQERPTCRGAGIRQCAPRARCGGGPGRG